MSWKPASPSTTSVSSDSDLLNLKFREGQYVFDAETLCEDLHSTSVIRMRAKGIIPIFEQ